MQTLTALLAAGAARHSLKPAVTDGDGTLDWRGFETRAAGLVGLLDEAGVQAGDRVALWLPNSADYLATIFACARLAAVAIHINTRFRSVEVGSLLQRTRARLLVTEWGFTAVDFPSLLAELPREELASLRVVLGRHLPDGVTSVAGLPVRALRPTGDVTVDRSDPSAPCLTFTTSGTTSGPKLVLHDQRGIAGHAEEVMRAMRTDVPDSALLAAVPFCGTFGNAAAMAAVAGGAHVVCMDRFDAAEAAALIRHHGITHAIGGDDMLARLIEVAGNDPFTSLRLFGFAAFGSGAAATAARAASVGLQPSGVYGSSEMQALFAISDGPHRQRAGGRLTSPGAAVSVRDPSSGAELPPGQSGELCFKGPSRFRGYLEDIAATRRANTADGWFRSGDLGHLDGDGFVYEARLGDTLRLGGFLVNPEEIESFLLTLPGVVASQVVGATREGDAVPVAFVTTRPGTTLDEAALLAQCRAAIARFKVPVRIAVLDEFPTADSPNGPKIKRTALRDMAQALLQSAA